MAMSLQDAIDHCIEIAKSCEVGKAEPTCTEEHLQLAEWLLELKVLRDRLKPAKVLEHTYRLNVIGNVVGEILTGTEYYCSACRKKVLAGDEFCSHCGKGLEWNEKQKRM